MSTPEDFRMPLWEHLDELRKGLVRSLLAVGVAMIATYNYCEPIMEFLERPLLDLLPEGERHLYYTGIADKFVIYFKVSIIAAFAAVSPYILYQVWRFISPALYSHERKFAVPFLTMGTCSFFIGVAFAYYVVIPYGYKFLIEFGSGNDKAIITLTDYFDITLKLMLALGLIFEVPMVLMLLAKIGLVNADALARYRRHAALVCGVIAAIATPSPDAFTMLIVMVPLYLLYEFSIVGIRWFIRPEPSAK